MIPASAALAGLLKQWDADAAVLARRGDSRGAEMLRACAAEARRAIEDAGAESLSLAQAALESGYGVDHLRHLVASGQVPQAGRKGSPRVLRRDIPRKPGARPPGAPGSASPGGYDVDADARSLAGRMRAS